MLPLHQSLKNRHLVYATKMEYAHGLGGILLRRLTAKFCVETISSLEYQWEAYGRNNSKCIVQRPATL